MASSPSGVLSSQGIITLGSVRDALIRLEDTIVFALIERANYPRNSRLYDPSYFDSGTGCSLFESYVRESEALQAKAGRYQNPEEVPFFPDSLPTPIVPHHNFSQILYPAAASVNVSTQIWGMYLDDLLPLFTSEGDDGNYAATAAADLVCLQAFSKRIHYGKFVAEIKFKDSPEDYKPAIHSQNRDVLMKLLTFEPVEAAVKKRVEKKAMIFAQNVTLDDKPENSDKSDYKIKHSLLSHLYSEWIIPLTKLVEVEYLIRRLD